MPSAKLRPDHFEHAVESVLNQSMREIELIIVLQNDPERHRAYMYEKSDARVFAVNVNAPYGEHFTKAYNHGVGLARSDIICFAHDDDVQLKDKAEILYSVMRNRPSVGMVHGGWCVADQDLVIQTMTWGIKTRTYEEYKDSGSFSPNAVGIRKWVFDRVKFNENYWRVHEFIWCLECMEAGIEFHYIQIPLFIQRVHESFSRKPKVKQLEFAEYERYRKERNDPTIAAGKEQWWREQLPELRQKGFYV